MEADVLCCPLKESCRRHNRPENQPRGQDVSIMGLMKRKGNQQRTVPFHRGKKAPSGGGFPLEKKGRSGDGKLQLRALGYIGSYQRRGLRESQGG